MRSLSADEQEMWARVAATIRPLSRDPQSIPEPKDKPARPAEPVQKAAPPPIRPSAPRPSEPSAASPGGTLDSGWDKRLRSGAVEPDRVLDLHGLTLDRAWSAIDTGLERAIAGGERILLLITGHARPGAPPVQRGKIRAAVHDWLAASRHASSIAAVRGAHSRHGGGGGLYIILRRKRPRSTIS